MQSCPWLYSGAPLPAAAAARLFPGLISNQSYLIKCGPKLKHHHKNLRKGHYLIKMLLWALCSPLPALIARSLFPPKKKKNSKKQIALKTPGVVMNVCPSLHLTAKSTCWREVAAPVKVGITFAFQQSCLEACNIPETAEIQGAESKMEQAADDRSCELQHPHRLTTERAPKTCLGWIPSANPKHSWMGCTSCKILTEALAELRGETVCVCVEVGGDCLGL